jgi:hypothetical protein
MAIRRFAMLLGIVFLIVGVLGFVPGVTQMHTGDHPDLDVEGPGHGYILGLFHVNVLHNAVHLLFGILGLVCARSFGAARGYARFVAVAYAALGVLGLISAYGTKYVFGLIPIEDHNVWLHFGIAVVAAYFGFIHPAPEVVTTTSTTTTTPPPATGQGR